MTTLPSQDSRTKLSETTYQRCLEATIAHLEQNKFIRNRDIREIAGIGYDQAITFFNRALAENQLKREGIASGTRYVRRKKSERQHAKNRL